MISKQTISFNRYKQIIILFKFLITVAVLYVIYDFIWIKNNNPEFVNNFKSVIKNSNPLYIIACIFLAPLNWIFEGMKWKRLVNKFNPLSFSQSLNAILLGISFGVITPGRIGEYGGRMLNIKSENISKALFANFVGSLAQNLINIFPGAFACFFFILERDQNVVKAISVSLLFFGIALFIAWLFFNSQKLIRMSRKIKFVKKYTQKLGTFQLRQDDLKYTLSLSILRYMIYVSQYILLLYYFQINIGFIAAISHVVLIFLLQSSIPLPPVIGLVARTQLAIFVFSKFDLNYTSILSVPVLLWIINLLIPSLSGTVILLKSNFNKYFQNV